MYKSQRIWTCITEGFWKLSTIFSEYSLNTRRFLCNYRNILMKRTLFYKYLLATFYWCIFTYNGHLTTVVCKLVWTVMKLYKYLLDWSLFKKKSVSGMRVNIFNKRYALPLLLQSVSLTLAWIWPSLNTFLTIIHYGTRH